MKVYETVQLRSLAVILIVGLLVTSGNGAPADSGENNCTTVSDCPSTYNCVNNRCKPNCDITKGQVWSSSRGKCKLGAGSGPCSGGEDCIEYAACVKGTVTTVTTHRRKKRDTGTGALGTKSRVKRLIIVSTGHRGGYYGGYHPYCHYCHRPVYIPAYHHHVARTSTTSEAQSGTCRCQSGPRDGNNGMCPIATDSSTRIHMQQYIILFFSGVIQLIITRIILKV